MKKPVKAIAILAMSLLPLFEFNQSCYAETVVHLDRNSGARSSHASSRPQPQAANEPAIVNEPAPKTPSKENAQQSTTSQPAAVQKPEQQQSPSKENTVNQSTDNADKTTISKAPKSVDDYLSDFTKGEPEFTSSFGEGGDLAGLSSSAYCLSTYNMKSVDTKEWLTITTLKTRTATAFYSDTWLIFTVQFNLKIPVIVSAKRPPLLELTSNGVSKIIKFKKISSYSLTGFNISAGNVHLLDELYSPNTTIVLLLETKSGPQLRVPIPENVIKQWQQVTSADLKKMRREFDER